MRRVSLAGLISVLVALGLVASGPAAAAKHKKTSPLVFSVRLIQEATHPQPNHVYTTTLRLLAMGSVLGRPNGALVGTMSFTWTLHGVCSSSAPECSGTADLWTVSKLPGGTIRANVKNLKLSHGLVVPVQGGTGRFKGASGTISIAPKGTAENIYKLRVVR